MSVSLLRENKKHIFLTPELRRCDQFDAFLRAAIATERSAIIQTFLQHFATVQGIRFDDILFFAMTLNIFFFQRYFTNKGSFLGRIITFLTISPIVL